MCELDDDTLDEIAGPGRRTLALTCDICGEEWTLVAPRDLLRCECPGCGHFCSIPGVWDTSQGDQG